MWSISTSELTSQAKHVFTPAYPQSVMQLKCAPLGICVCLPAQPPEASVMMSARQSNVGDAGDSADAVPTFHATALRHPAAAELHTTSFVPNDVQLGGDGAAPFIVLTGGAPTPLHCIYLLICCRQHSLLSDTTCD